MIQEARRPALFALMLAACSPTDHAPAPDSERPAVSMRDFFFYSCAREYSKTHAFPLFDSSAAYAVEYSDASAETLSRVHAAARAFALTMRAPDLSDAEHGGVAVLALCLQESRSARLDAVLGQQTKR